MKKVLILFLLFCISIKVYGQCFNENKLKIFLAQIKNHSYFNQLQSLLQLKLCPNVSDSLVASYYSVLAKAYFENKENRKAINTSILSLKKWKGCIACKEKAADEAYNVAYYNHLSNNYYQAIYYYRQCINITKDLFLKSYCHKSISELNLELGDYDNQYTELLQAEKLIKIYDEKSSLLAEIYNAKGIAFSRLQNELRAVEMLNMALSTYNKSKTKYEDILANIEVNYGISYFNLRENEKAITHYNEAERVFIKLGEKYSLANKVYNNLGLVETRLRNYKQANNYFIKAINLIKDDKSVELSRIYLNYASNLKQENKLDSATRILEKSIEVFPLLNIQKQNFSIIRSKRTLFYILRDYAINLTLAYQHNKKSAILNRSLQYFTHADHLLNLMRQEHQGQQSKSFWREHSRSLYESAIEACYLANDTKKAFYFLEKSRAMLLLDDLKENNARQLLSAQEQIKEKNFQQKLLELQIQLENKPEKSTEYQQIIGEIATLKLAFSDFKKDLEKRFPEYYTAKYGEDFKDLATLQKWLKISQHQAFISYFVGDSATYAMKVTPAATKLIKLPKDTKYLSSQFINFCADINALNTSFSSFLAISNQLYNELIKPVGLDEGRIIISYDDQFLPFEALSRSAKKADFMVEYHAISYAYSANFILKSIENKNNQTFSMGQASFLGVAPIHFSQSLPVDNLLLSGQSIKNIEDTFNGKLLLEGKATKDAFIKQFADYQLVQLYTHADTTKKGPVFYLQDAPMYVSEIRPSQPIKTELILLSACKTGLGKNIKGEGIFSLSRGFSALGIPSLITTLWSVDEKATYGLTELFHKNLKQGLSKDLALQKAKQEFIHQDTRNVLPTLWASSILIGDTSPISNSNWWWVSILFISILSSGLFFYSRFRQKNK